MVVIVILGILAALVVPRVLERPDEARVIAAKNDIAAIMQALKLYRLDNQRYPTTEQGLARWSRARRSRRCRPTGSPTAISSGCRRIRGATATSTSIPDLRGEIDVFSFGADGQPGGTGIDSDIGSWDL